MSVAGGRPSQAGGIGSPISDEAYNIITSLQTKLEGMEAYRKYANGGVDRLWQRMNDIDQQAVELLVDELERLVREGKLRTRPADQAG